MTVGELIFEVGFKADTMKLKDFGRAIGELNMSSILSAVSLGAVYEGAKSLIDIAQGMGVSVSNLSEEMDINSDGLQRWQGVATKAGVATEVTDDALKNMQKTIDDMAANKPPNQLYSWLLTPQQMYARTDAVAKFTQMMQNAQILYKRDPNRTRALLESLGYSPELIRVFKEISNIPQSLSQQSIIQKDKLKDTATNIELMATNTRELNLLFTSLGNTIIPEINKGLVAMNSHIKSMENSRLLKDVLWIIEHTVMATGKAIGRATSGLDKAYEYAHPSTWHKIATGELSMRYPTSEERGRTDPMGKALNDFLNDPWAGIRPALNSELQKIGSGIKNVVQHNTIHVNGASDPQATAQAIDERIGKHINQALSSGSTGSW